MRTQSHRSSTASGPAAIGAQPSAEPAAARRPRCGARGGVDAVTDRGREQARRQRADGAEAGLRDALRDEPQLVDRDERRRVGERDAAGGALADLAPAPARVDLDAHEALVLERGGRRRVDQLDVRKDARRIERPVGVALGSEVRRDLVRLGGHGPLRPGDPPDGARLPRERGEHLPPRLDTAFLVALREQRERLDADDERRRRCPAGRVDEHPDRAARVRHGDHPQAPPAGREVERDPPRLRRGAPTGAGGCATARRRADARAAERDGEAQPVEQRARRAAARTRGRRRARAGRARAARG